MKMVLSEIEIVNQNICKNIDLAAKMDRGFISQNILSQTRNLVEYISILSMSKGKNVEVSYDNIQKGNEFVKTKSKLNFLGKFHFFLQQVTSHYIVGEEGSERLMLKYYEYLIMIKVFVEKEYALEILENLIDFPISIDSHLKIYYEKIAECINNPKYVSVRDEYTERYYIRKIRPFFIGLQIFYEITLTAATDNESKFGRIIAFTKIRMIENYAVRLTLRIDTITLLGKKMPIYIIENNEVSIRPCEINNYGKIFGRRLNIQVSSVEYKGLMEYLTVSGLSLIDLVKSSDKYYKFVKERILENARVSPFFNILDESRNIIKNDSPGANVLSYLLYNMNNKIIKLQWNTNSAGLLSDLYLMWGCKPFDTMPFCTSLVGHNPRLQDIMNAISHKDREDELLARKIKTMTENEPQLYTNVNDLQGFENIEDLIESYNDKLYWKHGHRKIKCFSGNYYIKDYEENTKTIIQELIKLTTVGMKNYKPYVDEWLETYVIDCEQKKKSITSLFLDSRVALIYGSAGTGKSTMINHISNLFAPYNKLYLANTNPAIDNLKRKVKVKKSEFMTIASYTRSKNISKEFDVLFIDECSTVNNKDMVEILSQTSFKLVVLVGDIYQIESIHFGNWFALIKSFVPKKSVFELTKPYRTENDDLLDLWKKVRNIEDDILEHITRNSYSIKLDETIFENHVDDEIILCLNYDGLYGINNINNFLQISNPSKPVKWGILSYKINDPVLFNESDRFAPVIYNNLKGKIVDIKKFEDKIQFDVAVEKVITEMDILDQDFELLKSLSNGMSVIRFDVRKYRTTDDDDDGSSDTIVPFQVAYAVSIHKAQGLEYDSVKVVIADGVEELITHNIFYTAITRAKNNLKIYWTPENEKIVLENLAHRINKRDLSIFAAKNNLKINKK